MRREYSITKYMYWMIWNTVNINLCIYGHCLLHSISNLSHSHMGNLHRSLSFLFWFKLILSKQTQRHPQLLSHIHTHAHTQVVLTDPSWWFVISKFKTMLLRFSHLFYFLDDRFLFKLPAHCILCTQTQIHRRFANWYSCSWPGWNGFSLLCIQSDVKRWLKSLLFFWPTTLGLCTAQCSIVL